MKFSHAFTLSMLGVLCCISACKTTKETEGERMLSAVTAYRRATNAEVAPAALALEQTQCTDPDVC